MIIDKTFTVKDEKRFIEDTYGIYQCGSRVFGAHITEAKGRFWIQIFDCRTGWHLPTLRINRRCKKKGIDEVARVFAEECKKEGETITINCEGEKS